MALFSTGSARASHDYVAPSATKVYVNTQNPDHVVALQPDGTIQTYLDKKLVNVRTIGDTGGVGGSPSLLASIPGGWYTMGGLAAVVAALLLWPKKG